MRRRRTRKRPVRTRKALAVTLAAAHAAGSSGPGVEALVCPWSSSRHGVGEPVRGTTTPTGRLRRADPWSSETYPAAGLMPRACRSRTYAQSGALWWAWGAVNGKQASGVDGNQSQAPGTARANGAGGNISLTKSTAPPANGNQMAAFFAIPGLLNGAVAERPLSVGGAADAVQGAPSGGNWSKEGEEEGEGEMAEGEEESDNAVIMSLPTLQEQVGSDGTLGEMRETLSGMEDVETADDDDKEKQGRRRDMYKIRSLLLQGQIAGLRQKLKERELDVRELRVLTGGRGQSKLRELGRLLKDVRAECDALRAREKELAQELVLAQKESDVLRGDLLAGRKALADLNAYADSLRSRYTAEMVKLEASLAEMERELTRAEAAHMRERRDLLEREAMAVADGERFRNRTMLLQDEILKRRARETKLQQENARLTETVASAIALNDAAGVASSEAAVAVPRGVPGDGVVVGAGGGGGEAGAGPGPEAELASLRLENADLRSRLEGLAAPAGAWNGGDGSGTVVGGVTESGIGNEQPRSGGDPAVDEADGRDDGGLATSSALNGVGPVLPRRPIWPDVALASPSAELLPPVAPRILPSIPDAALVSSVPGGFSTRGAIEEANVARVVVDLREENGRLRKKLRAAAAAVEDGEARANEEARRAGDAEADLLRVRATVRGRVQALKVALEEAEAEADRAVREREGHMRQWAEDVDALRAQLIAERAVWDEDRDQLDSQIVDLEDELRRLKESYRRSQATASRPAKQRAESSGYSGERRGGGDKVRRSRSRSRSKLRSDVRSAPAAVDWNARDEGLRERESAEPREGDEREDGFIGESGKSGSDPDAEWSRAVQLMENLY